MLSSRRWIAFFILLCASMVLAQDVQEGRLLRFPDIHNDRIAFVYGGDIWLVDSAGGAARRVTSHPGRELFPKFSPDGNWIAFTGQYDGNFNVYVMPSQGGQPKQLTYYQGGPPLSDRMGVNNEVVTWSPDSKRIYYLTRYDASNGWSKRLYSVAVDGGLPEPMPMPEGGLTSFSPDGTRVAYNRIFRNFRTWKRYTGGLAQDISIYDLKANTIEQVAHTDWTDTFPMWSGNKIYFSSDRGPEHRLNLYSYDLGSKQVQQLTHFADWDVMWPSLGPGAIVFQNAGYLHVYDLQSGQDKKLSVTVPGERDHTMKRWTGVSKLILDFDISPDGKRAVFGARGEIFTVPAKDGSIRNLTRTPGIREQKPVWSPDGKWVAYISDRTGEDEIFITPQDGMGKEQQITSGYKGFKYYLAWSPDSRKLAWSDKDLRLWYVDISEKKPVEVDHGKVFEYQNYSWSPDSKWITYDKQDVNNYSVVYLYSLADKKSTAVTNAMTNSYAPMMDPDGRYLYFLSDRDYNEVLGNIDFEFANPKTTRVYVATLRKDEPSPFHPLSDESMAAKDKEKDKDETAPPAPAAADKDAKSARKETDKGSAAKEVKDVRIDLDGIQDRIVSLPIEPAVIRSFAVGKDYLYYSTTAVQGLSGPLPGEKSEIHAFDLKDRKEKTLIEGVDRFTLSFDGSKILYQGEGGPNGNPYGIIDAKPDTPKKPGDGNLNLAGMKMEVDPPAEWKEMFNEVWRQERDFFFEQAMNGVDWDKVRQKYETLLPYAASRYDATYIMGELIGELSNSHTYVGGGDYPDLHPVNVGLLGADYDVDHGFYRFKKIYRGENWRTDARSPLTEPGVNVHEGDYLLAVNGQPLRPPQTPFELMVNTARETVTLTVNSKPSEDGARTVLVKPIGDEYPLRELAWIEANRKKVDAATNGRVGYVYLPDMGAPGLDEFVKQYFPQVRKEGIIFDVRYNGGGFVDQLIFERLRRVLSGMQSARNFEPGTNPPNVFYGPMACVTNHYAASDGDFFSYFFKVYKLGPLIGERTWGGVRGIRGQMPLLDGGYITRPEFALYGLDSKWLIENHGVQPDIVVDQRPDLVIKGQDPQLEKAIDVVMKAIQENPKKLPPVPPDLPAYPEGPGF